MKFISSILLVLFSSFASAADKLSYIEVSKGQNVAFDAQIFDPNQPTLILLPGIFRGLQRQDAFVKKLIEKRMNFVALHFSTQPASVATYSTDGEVFFDRAPRISSEVFAGEVEALVKALRIQKPLAISLSYSASISQHLNPKIFDMVIETAPIGRFDENDPESAEMFRYWQVWLRWFPIWGDLVADSIKDNAYRDYWGRVAKQYAAKSPHLNNPSAIKRLTEGYMTMAKAVENFDLRTQKFVGTPYRLFVLGANEDPARRQIQNEAVTIFRQKINPKAQAIVIPNAGHVVPNDQPDLYLQVISKVLEKRYPAPASLEPVTELNSWRGRL